VATPYPLLLLGQLLLGFSPLLFLGFWPVLTIIQACTWSVNIMQAEVEKSPQNL
jgi:hypothetical protein